MRETNPVKVMIVDDSGLVRGILRSMLKKDPAIEVVVTCNDGAMGYEEYKRHSPDITLMDIEMPNMDGLTALKLILEFDPNAKIIMCSSLTQAGAEATYKALSLGAMDCLAKPSAIEVERTAFFEEKLVRMVKELALGKVKNSNKNADKKVYEELETTQKNSDFISNNFAGAKTSLLSGDFSLRQIPKNFSPRFPLAIAIGSSTGGPQALPEVFKRLPKKIMLPIFITQHIPDGFEKYLGQAIHKISGYPTHLAEEGLLIEPGNIYLAKAGMHMGVTRGVAKKITLIDSAPVSFCKPSITVMLDQIREAYDNYILTVMLTGMGSDGMDGCQRLADAGDQNIIIAQDQTSSVVWGIPGSVAKKNLCHYVLPLDQIGTQMTNLINRNNNTK